ncbi:hypothetical protein FVB32_10990 [Flagellimonas hymeniacidonis]|uniref:Uncharacterized protein n=1 Tax=Flagellimonas hymeniacidonis TaxID=2603628 RepID=A0A5C8V0G6_9FLAO|nr:hypothetical protein [Flagellimonas hymeniacidonis]TXN35110.1 hypothetical protein FVB32_10990 [Flagellimonas hymeniacidonis]
MAQDLKELFAKERKKTHSLKKGHESRFLNRLDGEFPKELNKKENKTFFWLGIAASVLVMFGLGLYFFSNPSKNDTNRNNQVVDTDSTGARTQNFSLGDLSPDLKKIESYYVTNINLELSGIEFTGDNKAIVDGYMETLADLDKEYNKLNVELNKIGPNDQTISALIKNLQLRLQLLQKLKTKLNQLKSSKNEQESSNII